jgi:hypothetical protein
MFHVKQFCPVGAKNLTSLKTAAQCDLVRSIGFYDWSVLKQGWQRYLTPMTGQRGSPRCRFGVCRVFFMMVGIWAFERAVHAESFPGCRAPSLIWRRVRASRGRGRAPTMSPMALARRRRPATNSSMSIPMSSTSCGIVGRIVFLPILATTGRRSSRALALATRFR